jgi:hypothetical protein
MRSARKTKQAPNSVQIDSILEKISKKGIDSLSEEEKRILSETSNQYKRRAQSKKPESGLAI